jgi:hypothetical protein
VEPSDNTEEDDNIGSQAKATDTKQTSRGDGGGSESGGDGSSGSGGGGDGGKGVSGTAAGAAAPAAVAVGPGGGGFKWSLGALWTHLEASVGADKVKEVPCVCVCVFVSLFLGQAANTKLLPNERRASEKT